MLAVTHHFIVALAASRVGLKMGSFWDYAVLGDDIVIANKQVAESYLKVMAELGVDIGLHKSLISRKGRSEFAKVYRSHLTNLSPAPFKEVAAALQSFSSIGMLARKYGLRTTTIARLYGYGFRVLGKLSSNLDKLPQRLRNFVI